MKSSALLLSFCVSLFFFFNLFKGISNHSILQNLGARIVNGTKAEPKQFPQQVSLRRYYSDSHFCGGSIITPQWVLSASHCFVDKNKNVVPPYSMKVVAGDTRLVSYEQAHQKSKVSMVIVHPKFNYFTLVNDVALLKLKSPFRFDPFIKPMPLADSDFPENHMCQVSGWGYPKFGVEIISKDLKYVDLPKLSITVCRALLKDHSNVPDGQFCAGYFQGGKDACQGDSGGGFICDGKITGVVSGGEGCGWPGLPGLYADVKMYIPWIRKHVGSALDKNYSISSVPQRNSASTFNTSLLIVVAISLLYLTTRYSVIEVQAIF